MERVALVTGGTRGIGRAISTILNKKGYKVVATFKNDDAEAQKFSKDTGIMAVKCDVSNYNTCVKHIKEIEEYFGKHIEILINNAGITKDVMFHKSTLQEWDAVIATNLTSCYNVSRAVIGKMRDNNFGRIVNISSVNALSGQIGQTNYAASKAGIIGFTKALALESASKKITVNAIAPGYADTDMMSSIPSKVLDSIIQKIPMRRLATPQEIAHAVAFLVADDSEFITGITLSVNGGLYMQ